MKKVSTFTIIAAGFLAAALWLAPTLSNAGVASDVPIGKQIVDFCKWVETIPVLANDPNCQGQCTSAIHVCFDKNGFSDSKNCERKACNAFDACGLDICEDDD